MLPFMIMNDDDYVACLASGHGGQRKKEEKEHSLNDRVAVVHAFLCDLKHLQLQDLAFSTLVTPA